MSEGHAVDANGAGKAGVDTVGADTTWKSNLLEKWRALGVPAFIDAIGLDFQRDFAAPLAASTHVSDPYDGYTWYLFDHPRLTPGVLHAHPSAISDEPTLWEEWFVEADPATGEKTLHHHLLRNHPHEGEEGQWRGVDDEHPEVVLDIQWHYINSTNPAPHFL